MPHCPPGCSCGAFAVHVYFLLFQNAHEPTQLDVPRILQERNSRRMLGAPMLGKPHSMQICNKLASKDTREDLLDTATRL